jgi:hypothetical protein
MNPSEMRTWMRANQAKRVTTILSVTIAVGWLGSKVIYDRIVHATEARSACINNLRWIAGSKELLAREKQLKPGTAVDIQDVAPYVIDGWRDCPAGGTYTVNPIGKDPTCSIPGHSLRK